jgi:sarcosine oxidase subunit delta
MTFRIGCPNCGLRDAEEFVYGGESTTRPGPDGTAEQLARYVFFRDNIDGWQTEWWYHRDGCQRWFVAERNTSTNEVRATSWPDGAPGAGPAMATEGPDVHPTGAEAV